jgi:hypothetical protein
MVHSVADVKTMSYERYRREISPDGVSGVFPDLTKVPQRMGDYQGVHMLFPPFKGDSRGLTIISTLEER